MPNDTPRHKPATPRVLFLADSRGRNLDTDLRDLLGDSFKLVYYPGATLMDTIINSEYLLKKGSWSQIYCLAGLCDVTVKNRSSHMVSIRNHDISLLVSNFVNILHNAHSRIMQSSPLVDSVKCIFCPITGLSLAHYNKRLHHPDDIRDQPILNDSITRLNVEIVKFNNSNNNITPWTSRAIHRRHRQSFTNYYEKLASDGCHLSPLIRHHWAETLHDAVIKNS